MRLRRLRDMSLAQSRLGTFPISDQGWTFSLKYFTYTYNYCYQQQPIPNNRIDQHIQFVFFEGDQQPLMDACPGMFRCVPMELEKQYLFLFFALCGWSVSNVIIVIVILIFVTISNQIYPPRQAAGCLFRCRRTGPAPCCAAAALATRICVLCCWAPVWLTPVR